MGFLFDTSPRGGLRFHQMNYSKKTHQQPNSQHNCVLENWHTLTHNEAVEKRVSENVDSSPASLFFYRSIYHQCL